MSTHEPPSTADSQAAAPAGRKPLSRFAPLLVPAVLCALLWLCGGPLPHFDDLFFAGPALELQAGRPLADPYIARWSPSLAHEYFVHAPFYSVVLGAWLSLVGVGRATMMAFPCLSLAVAGATMGVWLRRRGFSAPWMAAPLLILFFADQGLRHDTFALAFLGAALASLSFRHWPMWVLGGLCIAIAVATWPVLLGYAAGLLLIALVVERATGSIVLRVACLALGAAVGVVLFGLAIDWRYRDFVEFYGRFAAQVVANAPPWAGLRFQVANGFAPLIYGPLYVTLLGGLAWLGFRWRELASNTRLMVIALSVGLAANLFLQTRPMHQIFDFFASLLLLACMPSLVPRRRRGAVVLGLALIVGWTKSYDVLALARQDRDLGDVAALRSRALSSGKPIWFDDIAARYVFDYRLPEHGLYWNFTSPFPQVWPLSLAEKPAGVVWLISRGKADQCEGLERSPRATVFGHPLRSMPAKPWELLLID